MFVPRKEFEYLLLDEAYNIYFLDNGVLKKQPLHAFDGGENSPFLPQHPEGSQNIQISFATNNSYWMVNRSFSVPLTFITQGGEIIRRLRYTGKGFSEKVFILWLRKNMLSIPERYEAEYYGQIDMSKASDDPLRGVTVNTIEGGLLSYFNANNNVPYDINCDEKSPDVIRVHDDGMTLSEKYNFSFIKSPLLDLGAITPAVFLNNEGDSVGTIYGSPTYESNVLLDYATSSNYIITGIYGLNNVRIKGTFKISKRDDVDTDDNFGIAELSLVTSIHGHGVELLPEAHYTFGVEYPFDAAINLEPNEKAFVVVGTVPLGETFNVETTNFFISFNTRNTTTEFYARFPKYVAQDLLDKMTGTTGVYKFQSTLLETTSLVLTCGDAIRETDKVVVPEYLMSMSFEDFYTSISACPLTADVGVKIVGNTLFLEKKANLNNVAGGVIFDLGEVAGLTIDCAEDLLFSLFKCGYPDQSYDQNAGKYEFNSEQEWGAPTQATKNPLDITSRFRGDARGIEAIRGALQNKDTTDNTGDKQVFMVDVDGSPTVSIVSVTATKGNENALPSGDVNFDNVAYAGGANSYIITNVFKDQFTYNVSDPHPVNISANLYANISGSGTATITVQKNGVAIDTFTVNAAVHFFRYDYKGTQTLMENDIISLNADNAGTTIDVTSAGLYLVVTGVTVPTVYNLYREVYDSLSGVLDDTVYNVRLSPHRQLRAWGGYIKSVFFQQQTDQIIFNTAKKNFLLSTTLNGLTITENANETIGNLPGSPYFLPYIFKFTTTVPYTFNQVMQMKNAGYFKCSFNGITLYGLPIGNMSARPVTREPQEWTLLAAPNNTLESFLLLDEFALTIQNTEHIMYISPYNPVQWVKYDYSLPAKYQYKDLYDDWSFERFQNFYKKPVYFQKWQTTDPIKLQILTSGEGQLELFIYDERGMQVSNTPLSIIVNTAVPDPFILQQLSVTIATEGIYLFVLKNGIGENIAISEWQHIKVKWPKTNLFEYSSSYNLRNTYFNSWGAVSIRVEGQLMPADPDSDFTEFEDEEGDMTIVHDHPWQKQKLFVGDNLGIPDFMAMKMNLVTLLNACLCEGIHIARDKDSKLENVGFRPGYPFSQYSLIVRKAINELGLTVITTQDIEDNLATSFMIDQQALGMNAPGNINVVIKNT